MSSVSLASLPPELVETVLTVALGIHRNPGHVLCVNSTFYAIGIRVLYTSLRFRTIRQLATFADVALPVPYSPREIAVTLAGGTADFGIFQYLARALRRCLRARRYLTTGGRQHSTADHRNLVLPLELLYLRLNSHASNPSLHDIHDCLVLVNPRTFIWSGPDPGHHFSIAIVPMATYYLLQAIATWTAVEHITLTNISFPFDSPSLHAPLSPEVPLLANLPPLLRTLHLERATFLPSSPIALLACHQTNGSLEQIRLVDAYQESIWGRRLRRSDVEKAALALSLGADSPMAQERVRELVTCEARHERIMGGDRSDALAVLV